MKDQDNGIGMKIVYTLSKCIRGMKEDEIASMLFGKEMLKPELVETKEQTKEREAAEQKRKAIEEKEKIIFEQAFDKLIKHYEKQYEFVPEFNSRHQLRWIVRNLDDEELNGYYENEYKHAPYYYSSKKTFIEKRAGRSVESQINFFTHLSLIHKASESEINSFKRVMRRINELYRDNPDLNDLFLIRFKF